MANSLRPEDAKAVHLKLSDFVKSVHANLRKQYKETYDMDKIWNEHCQNDQLLQEYADAMHHMATDHWSKCPESRIEWCRETAIEYFLFGGLKKVFQKEARRVVYKNGSSEKSIESDSDSNEQPWKDHKSHLTIVQSPGYEERLGTSPVHATVLSHIDHLARGAYNSITLPFNGKIRLLDVGSCYNPFLAYSEFLSVGIDISPAKDSVYKCDFLHLETIEPLQVAGDTFDTFMHNLSNPIEKLPRESFHVIVFSLLLEYFPCSYPRWICCQKAHSLLQVHGLLLIITPDSSHQNKHAEMMKSWKRAIESIGFVRWRYKKQEHLHCIAFRKISKPPNENAVIKGVSCDLLYIPQDFTSPDAIKRETTFMPPICDENLDFFHQTLFELPGDISDECDGDT